MRRGSDKDKARALTFAQKALRRTRSSKRVNALLTSAARAAFRVAGRDSDLVVRHVFRVGEVKCSLPTGQTLKLWSLGDDHIPNHLYWRGWQGFEPETVPVFFRLARRASVIIDAGAHIGVYSLLAALANPTATIYAFEPMPTVRRRLVENIRRNAVPNIEVVGDALGDRKGTADFYCIPSGLPTTSSLSRDFLSLFGEGSFEDIDRLRVPVTTLDSFVAERGIERVDLVKIDTESTEADVLSGIRHVLWRDRPTVFCEVLPGGAPSEDLDAIVSEFNYRRYQLSPSGPMLRTRIEPDWRAFNYLFSPERSGDPPPLEQW
jgi:FkbM family methyltransferase